MTTEKQFLSLDGLLYYTEKIKAELGAYVQESIYGLVDGTIENVSNSKATYVRDYGFYQHQSLITAEFPNVVNIGNYAFYKCPNLTTVNAAATIDIGSFTFKECPSLTTADFPLTTSVGQGAFDECSLLSSVNLPLIESIEPLTFRQCESLVSVDLPSATTIKTQAFWSSGISSITLRSSTVCTLEDSNAFAFTPIESGTGYIYVPSELVDNYKTADGWSTYANQIRVIA